MPLRVYTPQDFEKLKDFASTLERHSSLTHRSFVDHYYAGNEWCRLFLFEETPGTIVGTLGLDLMRRPVNAGFQDHKSAWGLAFDLVLDAKHRAFRDVRV